MAYSLVYLLFLAHSGVAHQAALNGWLRVPRLLFLYLCSPEIFVRSLLLLPTPSAQYCLMGMVGLGAESGMRGVAGRVQSTESDAQRAVSIILLINL